MQVVRDHQLGLQCIWDAESPRNNSCNGAACPEQEPFTTWKFRSDGASKRIIDFIWWALSCTQCLQSACLLIQILDASASSRSGLALGSLFLR